jgi:cell shape-determining protein MreD
MRIIFAIILFLSIIIESTLLPFPIVFLVMTFFVCIFTEEAIYWAFAAGLLLDVFAFRMVGISSIFFLSVVWTHDRFRKKFHHGWIYYQFFTLLVLISGYSFLIYHHLETGELIICAILIGLTLFAASNIFFKEGERERLSL